MYDSYIIYLLFNDLIFSFFVMLHFSILYYIKVIDLTVYI
jgi:hypothetical protein